MYKKLTKNLNKIILSLLTFFATFALLSPAAFATNQNGQYWGNCWNQRLAAQTGVYNGSSYRGVLQLYHCDNGVFARVGSSIGYTSNTAEIFLDVPGGYYLVASQYGYGSITNMLQLFPNRCYRAVGVIGGGQAYTRACF
jgi:hypothetical protein